MLRYMLQAFLNSKDFSFKKIFRSLDLSIIAFRKSFVTKFVWFARTYFYFIGACLFKISINIFVKLVRLVNLRVIFSLLSKEFKSSRNKSFEKFLPVMYVIIFEGGFGKANLRRTVTTSLRKSNNPVSNT